MVACRVDRELWVFLGMSESLATLSELRDVLANAIELVERAMFDNATGAAHALPRTSTLPGAGVAAQNGTGLRMASCRRVARGNGAARVQRRARSRNSAAPKDSRPPSRRIPPTHSSHLWDPIGSSARGPVNEPTREVLN